MIHFNGVLDDDALNEFAGMAARRIAVARYRAKGMSWSVARKASLTVIADEELKEMIREGIVKGKHPKDAIHDVVTEKINFLKGEVK
jgi:hypothetical protein